MPASFGQVTVSPACLEESIVTRLSRFSLFGVCAIALLSVVYLSQDSVVRAQTSKSKSKPKPVNPTEVKKLDTRLEEVQRSFLKDTDSIIKGYEDNGQFDRAKVLLEVLQKLDPKNELIKKKLEHLDDQILESTEFDLDLDPSKSWQPVGLVVKDRLYRIEVDGDYKFITTSTVGPEGFPTKDPANDMVSAPLGAVVAVIVPPGGATAGGGGGGGGGGNNRQPNAFFVGAKLEQAAQRDGMLLLKVNVPAGSKCTGKLKVKVGGVNKST